MKVKKTLAGILSGSILMFSLPMIVGAQMMSDTSTSTDTSMSMDSGTQVFSDVSTSTPDYTAIMYLKDHGVIDGYPDGTFKPDQVVNRAEALKIILLGSGIQVADSVDLEPFRDVPRDDWYAVYVDKAKNLGIVQGYDDGTFKPAQTVNLVENLKILLLAQQIDVSGLTVSADPYADAYMNQWYAPYVEYAKEKNLIDADSNNMVSPAQGMTRGKLSEAMYRLMYLKEMGWDKYMTPEEVQAMSQQETQAMTQEMTQAMTQETTQQMTQEMTQETTQQTTQEQSMNVDIANFAFAPADLTISAGQTVVWTNSDSTTHTVTSDDGTTFDSGNLNNGDTFSYTFNTPGTYSYHCSIHPFMTGTVTVQ